MLIFIFCSCSCLLGIFFGGMLVDGRRNRDRVLMEATLDKLREIVLEYSNENRILKVRVEAWQKAAHNLESTLAQVSGTPKPNFGNE